VGAPTESYRVAQVSSPSGVTSDAAPGAVDGISQSDRTRALRGLDLSNDVATADQNTTGQGILDGLSRLRGVFDNQEAAITGISDTSLSNSTQLINLQLEVVKYSMLMDVTSKLTGKATQSFDTLMKGQ
jgi:type III secretion system YscI/HrpB-like protein